MSHVRPTGIRSLWIALCMAVMVFMTASGAARAQTTQPAPDPIGYNGGPTGELTKMNAWLMGPMNGSGKTDAGAPVGTDGQRVDVDGTKWKPYANPDNPTTAELSKDVVWAGMGRTAELWSKERWQAAQTMSEAELASFKTAMEQLRL